MPCFTTRRTLHRRGFARGTWGLIAFVPALLAQATAFATPIAAWTFETSPPAGVSNDDDYPNPISADSGTGIAGGHHFSTSTDWNAPVGNGSNWSFDANFWTANDYFQFSVPTTGYSDIVVSWDIARSSTSAPDFFELQYSTAGAGGPFGVGMDDFAVLTNDAFGLPTRTSWNNTTDQSAYTVTADLSALSTLDNNANVVFRLVAVDSATSASASVRVDNFQVSGIAVPEPASLVTMLVGGAMMFFAGRRRRRVCR